MIREFLQPETLQEALDMKEQYGDQAVYMANGARLNATPTRTDKTVAISLFNLRLDSIQQTDKSWKIGAMITLQGIIDSPELPEGLREAAGLIFSRNLRNQATIGGEIAINSLDCQILPALLAMGAELELAEGGRISVEAWQQQPQGLITAIFIPTNISYCRNKKIAKSCAGLPIVSAALAVTEKAGKQYFGLALSGVSARAIRLHDVEALMNEDSPIERAVIEKAVSQSVFPETNHLGSAEYKQHISGVLVGMLMETFNGWSN
ncbi:molybdopterin-dependent oxidoreductase FAD-binding subunit [Endozoicomonas sp. Mp262]|uniref:molybdopterin-dependent oxidoreductase FAD-binding subunit n=1 Tax=Endozoicomonas sp. Mp262 TaxID=2919499 RepID=UPI0021DAC243